MTITRFLLLLCFTALLHAATRSPTRAPTRAPTKAPTRAPSAAPTASCPCPAASCAQFTASFLMTTRGITNGAVAGTLIYDYARQVLAFNYTGQAFQEIYQFSAQGAGYLGTRGQTVHRITAQGACQPCGSYDNRWGFPVTWACGGCQLADPQPVGAPDARGCQNYTTGSAGGAANWAEYFGYNAVSGQLCYLSNQQRLFTLSQVQCGAPYTLDAIAAPPTCKCIAPIDIAISLDRSTSIDTSDTYLYSQFVRTFLGQFYFNLQDPVHSAQMAIVQWGTTGDFQYARFGNSDFTMDPVNLDLAARNIGCTRSGDCNFCAGHGNNSACVDNSYTCTGCGLRNVQTLYNHSSYIRRANAVQLAIVITDGVANTLYPGGLSSASRCCGLGQDQGIPVGQQGCTSPWQSRAPVGCYYDVQQQQQWLRAQQPALRIVAVGVGSGVDTTTLATIATDPALVYQANNFAALIANVQQIIQLACPEPEPQGLCGGETACGFCACGTLQLPDVPQAPNLCSAQVLQQQGACYALLNVTPPCVSTAPPCRRGVCDPALNQGAGGCDYTQRQTCPQISGSCFVNTCFEADGFCSLGACNTSAPGCCTTAAPTTQAPTQAGDTYAPTGAPINTPCDATTQGTGCGANGVCNTSTGRCDCVGGFEGVLCNLPPDTHQCEQDSDCDDSDACTVDRCDANYRCTRSAIDCDDGNACTQDACVPASGCVHIDQSSRCQDNDPCTTGDACDPATGQCLYTNVSCDALATPCLVAFCYSASADASQPCRTGPVECARPDNCTAVQCDAEAAACTNTTLNCEQSYLGLVVGLVGGAVAGITVAAAACVMAAAAAGGGAYAVSRTYGTPQDMNVHDSPLYKPAGKCAEGLSA